jgi:polyisoprenoid-binding protein YceI
MASRRRPWWWVGGALFVGLLLVVGGPFVYINFIDDDAPPPLRLSDMPSTVAGSETVPLAGTWNVTSGSSAGYRVEEVLFGQNNTAAGRTRDVTGSLTIDGTTVRQATVTVDLTNVDSDESRRDNQFRGRIMDVARFPNATFVLTEPIALGREPADGERLTLRATGDLTLRGTTRRVTADVEARRVGATIEASGSIPITFADFGIPNPSFAAITTEDHGIMEFLVRFAHA